MEKQTEEQNQVTGLHLLKISYACRTIKLFPFYSPSFNHLQLLKEADVKGKITCPLSSETMHFVVLVSDNFNLINCWFLSLV